MKWDYIVSYHGTVEADTQDEAELSAIDSYEIQADLVTVDVTERKTNAHEAA